MDQKGFDHPLNVLPEACPECHFSKLDFVPQPYYLGKGITATIQMAEAELGNLLVREVAKQVLETVAPGQCRFYSTQKVKTSEETGWHLAVPVNFLQTAEVKESIPRCLACGQPLHAHGTQLTNRIFSPLSHVDIAKSSQWISVREKPVRDLKPFVDLRHALSLTHEIYFSVRLVLLLKKLSIHGLYQCISCKERPGSADYRWVDEQLSKLAPVLKDISVETSDEWFMSWLSRQIPKPMRVDFSQWEKASAYELPLTYKTFIQTAGSKMFRNVDGEEKLNVRILGYEDIDFKRFRGKIKDDPEAAKGEDGIVFAATSFGDCFCFKVVPDSSNYPVYRYDHEMDDFEPYAGSFEACIRQWVEG